ncbi:MAG: nucleotidyltransferase domain-containing protein [Treponema sp.]|nr:nucleotidyltransferase domain-containing protein [Treponema sp.]
MVAKKIPESHRRDIEKAAALLKSEGCSSVFLFGSMVTGEFHQDSDIDIGISGLPPKKFFRVSASLDRATTNRVDLVDFDLHKDLHALLDSLGEVVEIG